MSGPSPASLIEPSRPYPSTSTSYDSSSAPSNLSPRSPGGPFSGMALLGPQVMNRPESAGRLPFPQPMHISSITDSQNRYGPEYDQMMHQDQFRLNRMMAVGPGMSGDPVQGHKRAYRQRRKDPSCDACRERKVKCDATDTSSCSECSSRSVKCQFTKETNRRMSSIKQVQDLEKQLLAARQQVSKLQSMVKPDTVAVEEEDDATPPQQARPNKRRRVANNYELASIQRNMRVYGRGIFRPPTAINPRSNPRSPRVSSPELPPKDLGAKLVEDYKACLHQKFPFVDWKLLSQQFDRAYRDEPVQAVHGESAAVLFGVFACGALRNHLDEGRRFFAALKLLVDFWATTPTMELIRAMLLSCLFLIETNNMSAAFSMVGHAVRAAQDIGLHHQTSATTSEEEELKRNLWLTLFCIERTVAYELGRPSMISDEDITPLAEDEAEWEDGQPMSRLETIVSVAKAASHLRRAFKNPVVSPPLAQTVDADLNRCMSRLPPHLHLTANERLAPSEMHIILYLQDIRLLLHRHNLNPSCPPDVRESGITECLSVAKNTARLLSRVLITDPQLDGQDGTDADACQLRNGKNWEKDMRLFSSTFMCLHIWRCMLFLTACEDFEGALLCAMAGRAVGKARAINGACGRYYEFFLDFCVDRRRHKLMPLEEDEELIAYLSADLQGNLDQAWVWQDERDGKETPAQDGTAPLVDGEDEAEWNSWDRMVEELKRLLEEQKPRAGVQQAASQGSNGSYLAPKVETAASPTQQLSPSNRMSIADLI